MKTMFTWKVTGRDANGTISTESFRSEAEAEAHRDALIAAGGDGDVWRDGYTFDNEGFLLW